jgi:hypothetical protein
LGAEVTGGLVRGLRPPKYLQPVALTEDQIKRKEVLDKHGIPYTADEITQNPFHALLTEISNAGTLSRGWMRQFRAEQGERTKIAVQRVVEQLGEAVPPNELGATLSTAVKEQERLRNATASWYYNEIEQALKFDVVRTPLEKGGVQLTTSGGLTVPVRDIVSAFQKQAATIRDHVNLLFPIPEGASKEEVARITKLRADRLDNDPWFKIADEYSHLGPEQQWNVLHGALKDVRRELRTIQELKSAGQDTSKRMEIGGLKQLEINIEKRLREGLEGSTNPDHAGLLEVWDAGQQMVRDTSAKFRNDTITRLVQKAEQAGTKAVRDFVVTLAPEEMQRVMTAVSHRGDLQNTLRAAFLEEGLVRSSGKLTSAKEFDAQAMLDWVNGKSSFTAQKAEVLLPPKMRVELGSLLHRLVEVENAAEAGKTGEVFMRMKTAGMLVAVPTAVAATLSGAEPVLTAGTAALGTTAFLLGPKVLAKIITNEKGREFLIQGMAYKAVDKIGPLRVLQELMRLDTGVARTIQFGLHRGLMLGQVEAQPGGPPARTAESTSLIHRPLLPGSIAEVQ